MTKWYLGTFFLLLFCVTGCGPQRKTARFCDTAFSDSIAAITVYMEKALGVSISLSEKDFRADIAEAAAYCRASAGQHQEVVALLIHQVYEKWNMQFLADAHDVNGILPRAARAGANGSCLGISLLMLLIAEQCGCPLHGVLLPGHFFVRFDNGVVRRNIEPNANGVERTDDYYRNSYSVKEGSWYRLTNASYAEVLGLLNYNCGNTLLHQKLPEYALLQFSAATEKFPDFAVAWGNMAITLAQLGRLPEAQKALETAARLQPDLPGIQQMRAVLESSHIPDSSSITPVITYE
jgi:tetratricopeptide (TPR) repeat protein